MSIHYKVQQKGNPRDLTAPKKYYLTARSLGYVDRKEFIDQMVRNTSLTANEAASALDYLLEALPMLLKMGFTVKLGELGHFRTTISCEGSAQEADATIKKVRDVRIKFVCGRGLRQEIQNAPLEKFPE